MSDPLYHAEILDLAKAGRSIARLEPADVSARVDNPICGDRVTVDLAIRDGRVTAVGAKVQGCALCQAATAIIAAEAVGAPAEGLLAVRDAVAAYLAGKGGDDDLPWARLAVFAPVRAARSRHDCVMLPFKAAVRAIVGSDAVSS